MRIVVFGYHEIGYVCLQELLEAREDVVALVTARDDPLENIWFRSVAGLARAHGVPVHTPAEPNDPAFVETFRGWAPDIVFSFYYRRLLGSPLLAIPRRGCMNLHGSLLPRYRGRNPINWVLINGEERTGVTLHYMDERADHGDIIAQREVPIFPEDTALSLFRKMTGAARGLFRDTWPLIKAGQAPRRPQDHAQATYCRGRCPEDGLIDWEKSARDIANLVRAVTHPYPGAFTSCRGRRLFVWAAEALNTAVRHHSDGSLRPSPGPPLPNTNDPHPDPLPAREREKEGASLQVRNGVVSARADGNGGGFGTLSGIVPGRGLLVSTGMGDLLVRRAQLEGGAEMGGDVLAAAHGMRIGDTLGT